MSFLFLEYDAVRPEKIMYFPVNIQAGILFSHKILLPVSCILPSYDGLHRQSYALKESFLLLDIFELFLAFLHFSAFLYQKNGVNPLHLPTVLFEPADLL